VAQPAARGDGDGSESRMSCQVAIAAMLMQPGIVRRHARYLQYNDPPWSRRSQVYRLRANIVMLYR
jgi:hypothetical protein